MLIPDQFVWGTLGGVGVIIGWFVRLERRLNERLTRAEHQEICDRQNGEVKSKLENIEQLIERQNESSMLHRQLLGDSLASIRTQVAVIRDRMGDDPLKDSTGRFRSGM